MLCTGHGSLLLNLFPILLLFNIRMKSIYIGIPNISGELNKSREKMRHLFC